ncbi:MAG: DUF2232 domain-containing protein [Candidatus Hydrogenedentes bacterium]|nr:DUF2232 domain-containing protein [Candidatus Hydrogenedentota bacterium]
MLKRVLLWVGLLLLGASSYPLSLGIFPVLVAVCVARKRLWQTAGVLAIAAVIAPALNILLRLALVRQVAPAEDIELSSGQLLAFAGASGLEHLVFACTGLLAGAGMARFWPYGRIVYVVTAYLFGLMALFVALTWTAWAGQIDIMFETLNVSLHDQAKRSGAVDLQDTFDKLAWIRDHKASLVFGWSFAATVMGSCAFTSISAYVLRRYFGHAGPSGSFVDMRPSEWLVWGAIVAALLCFAYQRWPHPAISFVAWNGALALSAVYCLNGLGILLYGIQAFRPGLLIFVLFLFVLVNVGTLPMLMLVGLFDTWGDYRRKIDAILAARQGRDRPGGDTV